MGQTPQKVIIAGPSGSGKTMLRLILMEEYRKRGILVNGAVLDDADFLELANLKDHGENLGRGHVHPSYMQGIVQLEENGHRHVEGDRGIDIPTFPFVIEEQRMIDWMWEGYFPAMEAIDFPGVTFCDWAGGRNRHEADSPFAVPDLSFTYALEGAWLEGFGVDGKSGIERLESILRDTTLCIHPVRSLNSRLRHVASDRTPDVTLLFGDDDFDALRELLNKLGIPILEYPNEAQLKEGELERTVEQFVNQEIIPLGLFSFEGASMHPERL